MHTPYSLKVKILKEWLEGYSRDFIATNNEPSGGQVSLILKEIRSEVPALDLMRELALQLKKRSIKIDDLSTSLRLNNRIKKLGITFDLAEDVIEKLHVHCYREGVDVFEFFHMIANQVALADQLGINVKDLQKYILEKSDHLRRLINEINTFTEKRDIIAMAYKTTIPELEEFQDLKPIHEKLIMAMDEIERKDEIIKQLRDEISRLKDNNE